MITALRGAVWTLGAYAAVNALYLARCLAAIALRLGRFERVRAREAS